MNSDAAPTRPRLFLIISLSLIGGLYILFLVSNTVLMLSMYGSNHSQVMSATQELPQSDFAMFWYSGKLLFMNFANGLGYHLAPTAWMKQTFQLSLTTPTQAFHLTWMYPPIMGLLAVLYSSLPLALSFWVWRIIFLSLSATLLRKAGLSWPAILMGLAGPAELHDMLGGQNGALTGGFLVSSLLLMDKKPAWGGGLAGLLSIKPQLGLMLPFILLNRQRIPALIACIISVAILALITLPVEGWQSWLWFFTYSQHAPAQFVSAPMEQRFPAAGITIFFMARSLHASVHTAWVCQAVSSLISAILIWHKWRTPAVDQVARMASTLCLWILLTPYGYLYDLVGFSVALAAMFMKAPDWQKPIFGLLWLAAGYTLTLTNFTGIVLMPVAAVIGACMLWGWKIPKIIQTESNHSFAPISYLTSKESQL